MMRSDGDEKFSTFISGPLIKNMMKERIMIIKDFVELKHIPEAGHDK